MARFCWRVQCISCWPYAWWLRGGLGGGIIALIVIGIVAFAGGFGAAFTSRYASRGPKAAAMHDEGVCGKGGPQLDVHCTGRITLTDSTAATVAADIPGTSLRVTGKESCPRHKR